MSTESTDKINKLFESTLNILKRSDKQDWLQVANDYVVDTFGSPNLMHFAQSSEDEQKTTFAKAVIEAMKHGNKHLLVPEGANGHVKAEEDEVKAEAEEPKAKDPDKVADKPEPANKKKGKPSEPDAPEPAPGGIEAMLVESVLKRIGDVHVPTEVIEATVKDAVNHEITKVKETLSNQFREAVDEMKAQVNEFTKSTPPRDVFNVQLTVNSQEAMDASAKVMQKDVLNAIQATTNDHETK